MKNIVVLDGYTLNPGDSPGGCQFVELDDIFRVSDVISLHCPLTPQTENIINKERLERMKKTAFLINTSRGPLVDEQALAQALNNERIAGARLYEGTDGKATREFLTDCYHYNPKTKQWN